MTGNEKRKLRQKTTICLFVVEQGKEERDSNILYHILYYA